MGQKKSKPSGPMGGGNSGRNIPPIPPDSPLGLMIKNWSNSPSRRGKSKVKMIHYCVEIWGNKPIKGDSVFWPLFGSFEDWICQALNIYVNSKEPFSLEESEYAHLWINFETGTQLYPLKEKGGKGKKRDLEVPVAPPPYVPSLPTAPSAAESEDSDDSASVQGRRGPVTRSQTRRAKEGLYPLREIAMGGPQPGMGYVAVPINSGDVRDFKKEMGSLLEDPLGVAEQVDQFLGPNIYTWEELQSILGILFTSEERGMIRRAGMRIWDQQHQQGPAADIKWPMQTPNWNNQDPIHRGHMQDLRTIIIQGIRESVPRGQNINKAFSEQQKKDETPTEWLERLRKSLQLYSGLDPGTPLGEALLKTQFVAKSWIDIRKKLEKIEDWQDRGLDELLREAQKVYVHREDEKEKKQVRMMVAAVREGSRRAGNEQRWRNEGFTRRNRKEKKGAQERRDVTCFYCNKKGHMKRECRQRKEDEKMFRNE